MRRKVLFFTPQAAGGAERMTLTIAKMLPDERYEKIIVIVGKSKGAISQFIPAEYRVITLSIHNIYDFVTLRLWNLIRIEKPQIVFCSLHYINVRLIIAAKLNRVKTIIRSNTGLYRTPKSIVRMVERTYPYADIIIAQQEDMKNELLRHVKPKTAQIVSLPNPIDIQTITKGITAMNPLQTNQINFVSIGGIGNPVKAQDILIKAFNIVHSLYSNSHLYIVGGFNNEMPMGKVVKQLCFELDLEKFVHFVGFDPNPYKWLNYCDCFVLPSRQEGLPNSLIEAQYLKKPSVSTLCVPIISQIIRDGYNGYIVPVDDYKAMAEAMVKALKLKTVNMTYEPSKIEDFISLFDNV